MKIEKGTKKILKVAVGIILIMLLMVMINFYPTLNLNSSSMSIYSGEWIDVYYENEETAAADVFEYAVLHEIVHAYISVMNPQIRLWLTEGCALYLANGSAFSKDYLETMPIPSFGDTLTRNPISFADCGGYTFAHTYIEYINLTYGWDKVLELIKTEDYIKVLGKTQREIYDEWVEYLINYEI